MKPSEVLMKYLATDEGDARYDTADLLADAVLYVLDPAVEMESDDGNIIDALRCALDCLVDDGSASRMDLFGQFVSELHE